MRRLALRPVGTVAASLLLCALPCPSFGAPPPSFGTDVAPILERHCVTCHRNDGDAPFALETYDEARRHGAQIVVAIRSGYMPPWKPDAAGERFVGERRLSESERATIVGWVEGGTPAGSTRHLPARAGNGGWIHGQPDLIVELPAYTLRADGPDVFRNFVVTVPGRDTRYVRGYQFRPGNRAVHHANIRIDATLGSRQLDAADPEPGYEGTILHSADYPDGQFLGWTPGQAPPPSDDAVAWRLTGGDDFVVQLHMRPTGKTEIVRPAIGLYFGAAPSKVPSIVRLGRQNLDMPAGAADVRVSDTFTLPVDAELHAIQPHAHYRATSVVVWAVPPGASRRLLLRIGAWDINWQDAYRYAAPFWLPAGTQIEMEYRFDNSAHNPRNPLQPPQRVEWGWRSADEMADVWIQMLTRTPDDRDRLQRVIDRKMLTEDAVGGERLLEREPDHVALRNDTAAIYMKLGQPLKALEHFAHVTRLEDSPSAWFNEGVALQAAGRRAEARDRYQRAIAIDPGYASAHTNLGSLLIEDGRIAEARSEFERAIAADASNADAQANLALVLAQAGEMEAALTHMRQAVIITPPPFRQMTPFIWLLAAHASVAARRPAVACELAERLVAATNRRDAAALDALGIALAAADRFDEAARAASEALTLGPADAEAIRERLALYRTRRAFVLKD
jgi:Flp pilus assembly protein TadD